MGDRPNTAPYPAQKTSDAVPQHKHYAMTGEANRPIPGGTGKKTPA